ncbi:MAG: VWA domain-containing protein [Acidobacteriota bacterium]
MRRCRLCGPTLVVLVCAWFGVVPASAQTQNPPDQGEDVIKVNTSLVQTDVMVFNKQGGFIEGLTREQFVLKIDGKPRDISFFELVRTGSRNEEAQLAAARGANSRPGTQSVPLDRGRTVFFFIDDLKLSTESMHQARQLLTRFVTREMGQNDRAAIASTTGQIGFLQQLTDNKMVLNAAIDKLKARPRSSRDFEKPPMSEYQALMVDRMDQDVLGFFVDAVIRDNPGTSRQVAEEMVRGRASQMLHYSASLNKSTLTTLASLIQTSSLLPGRKIVFFISDGFFLDTKNSDTVEMIRKVTTAAAASGVIIYSIDARGLVASPSGVDGEIASDPTGRLQRGSAGELTSTQDGLNALARDTGGKPVFNTNDLAAGVTSALKESSTYYLLAWRPETDQQKSPRFRRVEVSILQKPDLVVRFRSGWNTGQASDAETRAQTAAPKTPVDELRAALRSVYPKTALPVSLSLNFLNLPERGSLVSTAMEIPAGAIMFDNAGGTPTATVQVVGVVFDDQGKVVNGFEQRIGINGTSASSATSESRLYYNQFFPLKPGLYQVRVAAYDTKGARAGSAIQWISVPDLAKKTLTLSTLIVGEKEAKSSETQNSSLTLTSDEKSPFAGVRLNVDRHFARSSQLRFLIFVYNAVQTGAATVPAGTSPTPAASTDSPLNDTGAGPDLAVQVQVFRDDEPVITSTLRKIQSDNVSDLGRLPYAAELSLKELNPGSYVLQVAVIDRRAKSSAVQRLGFQVD